MYSLFGQKARQLFWPVIIGLVGLAVVSFFVDNTFTWGIWILLLFFFGRSYAEPLDNVTPLDGRRRWIAIVTLVIFVLVFVPIPFRILG